MKVKQDRGEIKMIYINKNKLKQDIEKISGVTLDSIREHADSFKVIIKFNCISEVNGATFFLDYLIEINIPKNYPIKLPTSREYGERKIIRYHHLFNDNTFCIGTNIELYDRLLPNYGIDSYINLIAEYLTIYKYFSRYKVMPVTERSHGSKGILEGYKNLLDVNSNRKVLELIKCIPVKNKMRNKKCPCGSKKDMKKCHFNQLRKITNSPILKKQVEQDFI